MSFDEIVDLTADVFFSFFYTASRLSSSVSPRLLLLILLMVLVREFESRRGEISIFFRKDKKRSTAERA